MIDAKIIWEEVSAVSEIEEDVHDMKEGIDKDHKISMAIGLAAIQLESSDYKKIALYLGIPRSWVQVPHRRLREQGALLDGGVISGDESLEDGCGIAWILWSGVGAGIFERSAS
ncbi:hypothetical protein LCGC14_0517120 [marine sediment metagenome]|uniref:Uncharacterized protein n=1 Tax=marine sediment metagenome TaxID=412755 RepID=A0A0F9V7V6_9ZZZZ